MRVIVTGGRNFTNSEFLFRALDSLAPRPALIIEGGQRTYHPVTREIVGGADYWAKVWAERKDIEVFTIMANWRLHGRAAGPLRNMRLLSMGQPDIVISFPGGAGTADMVSRAISAGIPVKRIQ